MDDFILNQLKMAKILIAMEFDTQEEMDEYRKIHAVRPTTRMTVKKHDYGPQHYDDPEKFADRVHGAHNTFWHGTPSGDLKGGTQGLHVGTKQSAREALHATIGFRADGKDWDGTEEYGDVLLAGQDRIKEIDKWGITGINCDFPKENFKLKDRPDIAKKIKHSNGDIIPLKNKPTIVPVRVNGKMWHKTLTDDSANRTMKKKLEKGDVKHGYYYENISEDAGSISAVVPDERHISMVPSKERLKKIWHDHHGIPNQMKQASLLIISALEEFDDWIDEGPAYGEREKRNWRSKSTGEVRVQIIKPTTPSVKESVKAPTMPQDSDRDNSPLVTPEEDDAYLKAIKRGHINRVRKMVDDIANRAGYQKGTRLTVGKMGLLNNQALNYDRLNDSQMNEVQELLGLGLNQPRGVPKGSLFYFTDDGLKQHSRLIKLLTKAAKGPVSRSISYISKSPVWDSEDGQLAESPDKVKSADPIVKDDNGEVIPLSKRFGRYDIGNNLKRASMLILSALEEFDDWIDEGPAYGEREKRNWRSKSTGEVRIQIIRPTTPSVKESVNGPKMPQDSDRGNSPHKPLDNNETYLRALKSGDMGLAQKMVDETAKVMGYTIKAAHSTNSPVFHSFNTSGLAAHFGTMEAATDRANQLREFSENVVGRKHNEARVLSVALKIRNPLEMPDLASLTQTERGDFVNIEEARNEWLEGLDEDQRDEYENGREVEGEPRAAAWESETDFSEWLLQNDLITSDEFWDVQYDSEKAVQLLIEKGYDGIVYENAVEAPGSESYIVFSPSQVKSADPVVKDDGGNVIPLSKRFNSSSSDIRY